MENRVRSQGKAGNEGEIREIFFVVSLSLEIKNWNRNKFSPTSKRRVSSAVQIFQVKRKHFNIVNCTLSKCSFSPLKKKIQIFRTKSPRWDLICV